MNIDDLLKMFAEQTDVVGLGPSALGSLALIENPWRAEITIAIPDTLLRLASLVREGSAEHRDYLIKLIRYYQQPPQQVRFGAPIDVDEVEEVEKIVDVILVLHESDRLLILGEEVIDPGIERDLVELHPASIFEISLSPKSNFLRDYIVRVYSWSKRTGGKVVECGDKLYRKIGRYISTLQLPDRLDRAVDLKSRYIRRLFGFKGGKATRYFVGLVVGVGGLAIPAFGVAGAVIAFADP